MNDIREFDSHELHQLQRRVARNDARIRMILRGTLLLVVLAGLGWASVALSEPDSPFTDVHDDLYRFAPNTPAVADEINSNFSRLRSLDDANAQAIADLAVSEINGGRLANGTVSASKLASGAVNAQVRDYIRSKCYIHIGWRDNCNGCNTVPATWAAKRVGNTNASCDAGSGERTCKDGWAGIGTHGQVDGNDLCGGRERPAGQPEGTSSCCIVFHVHLPDTLVFALFACGGGCGDDAACDGELGCTCMSAQTCDDGLACVDQQCQRPDTLALAVSDKAARSCELNDRKLLVLALGGHAPRLRWRRQRGGLRRRRLHARGRGLPGRHRGLLVRGGLVGEC